MRITGQVWSIERSWHREMEQEEREDVCETETTGSCVPEGMSKNQWKKMLKRKKYEEGRQEWKSVDIVRKVMCFRSYNVRVSQKETAREREGEEKKEERAGNCQR